MIRRTLRRASSRAHALRGKWYLRPLAAQLADSRLWRPQRRAVAAGLGVGFAASFVPLPIHTPLAIVVAALNRLNVPAAIVGAWINNPLTLLPLYYLAYRVGVLLLPGRPAPFEFELSWSWVEHGLGPMWRPFLLGCLVCGVAGGFAVWLLADFAWRWSVRRRYRTRRRAHETRSLRERR